jgi:TonB-dependent SusC/RagA subfamily outer membrane receptor
LPGNSFRLTGTVAPLYVLDGKVMEPGNLNSIDPGTIQHINVLKRKTATALYGEKGANGVVEVKTKNTTITGKADSKFNSTTKGLTGGLPSGALYFIDGKEATSAEVEKLNPDLIRSINVLKDEAAVKL